MSSVDVVIVSWNTGGKLTACVDSVFSSEQRGWTLDRVVVLDNASDDDSFSRLESQCTEAKLELVRNNRNLGFAAACNEGARRCTADILLFLNPDTVLSRHAISVAAEDMRQSSGIGSGDVISVVGIRILNEAGQTMRTCSRFPSTGNYLLHLSGLDRVRCLRHLGRDMAEWDHRESRIVDQVMGAFFMVSQTQFATLGGFDERFFVYYEEVDYCRRIRQMGGVVYFDAAGTVLHHGGVSAAASSGMSLYYSWRSQVLYFRKNIGRGAALIVGLGTLLVEPVARLMLGVFASRRLPDGFWVAYSRIRKDLVAMLFDWG
jgi:GT2 family glycosyltransferase